MQDDLKMKKININANMPSKQDGRETRRFVLQSYICWLIIL